MGQTSIRLDRYLLVQTIGEGPGRYEIRVVSWNGGPPQLEKRQIILDRTTNQERNGKAKGFNREDFITIQENLEAIQSALRGEKQSDERKTRRKTKA